MEVLKRRGPLKSKEIARESAKINWGHPLNVSAINQALTEYLRDEVVRLDGGRWAIRSDHQSCAPAFPPAGGCPPGD